MNDAWYQDNLRNLIKNALAEDVGPGDYSTLSCVDPLARGQAVLKVKEAGILAGVEVAGSIFRYVQPDASMEVYKRDGDPVVPGDIAFTVTAAIRTILTCERLVLNCMQRMSGIATLTRRYTARLEGYRTRLLDTRKTTPNFRLLEKEAVRIGGGYNHRFGLFDMIMLKDNHIDFCGGIDKAVSRARDYVREKGLDLKIEVETRTLDEVAAALETQKVDRILLDNFTPEMVAAALKMIGTACETEASGGITLENIERYAATGVDFISSGAIIHHAGSLDLSLKARLIQ